MVSLQLSEAESRTGEILYTSKKIKTTEPPRHGENFSDLVASISARQELDKGESVKTGGRGGNGEEAFSALSVSSCDFLMSCFVRINRNHVLSRLHST